MLFEELPALGSFTSVRRAKELGRIPIVFNDYFSDECSCGSERMVRLSNCNEVSGICCVDPHCFHKVANQLSDSLQKLGFKGLGSGTAYNILQNLPEDSRHFADILVRDTPVYGLIDSQYTAFLDAIHFIKEQKCTRTKFISSLMYPYVGEKVANLFPEGDDFFSQVRNTTNLFDLMNLAGSIGVSSPTEQYHTAVYLPDIVKICDKYRDCIINTVGKVIGICMTGHMDTSLGSFTKNYYLAVCNASLVEDGIPVTLVSVEAVSKAMYVIAGEDAVASKTAKYMAGLRVERANPGSKVVYSPEEFIHTIQRSRDVIE